MHLHDDQGTVYLPNHIRKIFPYFLVLLGVVCPFLLGVTQPASAAQLELRGRNSSSSNEVRIPLGQTAIIDVWMDAQDERIRTLNLYLRYDPQVIRAIDVRAEVEGVNPFTTGGFMSRPDEVFNAALEDKGELFYGVTNGGSAWATGAGVVASFQVEVIAPKLESDITVDFRFPLNFTSSMVRTVF